MLVFVPLVVKTAFAYSDEINLPALQQAANATKAIAAIGAEQTASRIITPAATPLYLPNDPIASLSADAKVKLLERLEQFAKQADPVSRKSWRLSVVNMKLSWLREVTV